VGSLVWEEYRSELRPVVRHDRLWKVLRRTEKPRPCWALMVPLLAMAKAWVTGLSLESINHDAPRFPNEYEPTVCDVFRHGPRR